MQLVVHGGAGSTPDDPAARRAVLRDAVAVGAAESTPLDAVVAALGVLEASPRFNAGRGGSIQADGVVRVDAGVMTDGRRVGAVCSMPGVVRATAVARAVLERTPHVLVAGEHAVRLAELAEIDSGLDLTTDATRQRYADADPPAAEPAALLEWVGEHFGAPTGAMADDHDTVGAVAVASDGSLAAATSTGGRWFAFPGRVGDSPQVGAGYGAGPAGGASATGWGEDIVRSSMCRYAVDRLDAGDRPQPAAEAAVERVETETGGRAGLIVADRRGRVGSASNTASMQVATDTT